MKLIGMLDSPYVRRVAISLELYGVDFVHEPLSVFRTFDEFAQINPVVKAPTLVLDDGTVLMDSSLILEYLETLAPADRKLLPQKPGALARDLHILGLALAACEKSVQIVYEHNLRPAEKLHAPWLERVSGQLLAAYGLLDKQLGDSAVSSLWPRWSRRMRFPICNGMPSAWSSIPRSSVTRSPKRRSSNVRGGKPPPTLIWAA
jgi:glutathione S-transferase